MSIKIVFLQCTIKSSLQKSDDSDNGVTRLIPVPAYSL